MSKLSLRGLMMPLALAALPIASAAHAGKIDDIRHKLDNPNGGVFVVAHRGCHNPYPKKNLKSAPENSFLSLDRCVELGVDMMELDIRRTKDGALVLMHDETVDRTTNGKGRVNDLTLAEIKALRLKERFGGQMSPTLTNQTVPTLMEILNHAKGRIMINLDIKEDIYDQVIAESVAAGMADYVLVKKEATPDLPPLSDQAPYDQTPFLLMVRTQAGKAEPADLAAVVARQASGKQRLTGVEMIFLRPEEFKSVRQQTQKAKIRLWANTLTQGGVIGVIGIGGDLDSLRDPATGWGYLIDHGVSIIQTDEPGPLINYLKTKGR